jgi:hypothetical protein
MISTSPRLRPFSQVLTPAAAALILIGLTATPSSARQDPGPATTRTSSHDLCPLRRLGAQFVRCDNLTGNGVEAPGWIPRADSAAPTQAVASPNAIGEPTSTRTRRVENLTTSGSFASGFAWASDEHVEMTVHCATFDAGVSASVSDRFTVSFDPDGTVADFTETVSAPRSVWTNIRTGASIEVRGHYVQVGNRVPGTHQYTRTVTGSTSRLSDRGKGAASPGGDHSVRYNQNQSAWKDLTGHHYFADAMLTEPSPCEAIA